MSLVELMVGIAVGLFVVAGASMMVSTQLGDNRRLLLDTQLQQDLRATADIITRELRRAGSEGATDIALQRIWHADSPGATSSLVDTVTPDEDESSATSYMYRRSPTAVGPFGFQLDADRGVIQSLLTGSAAQDLTDANIIRITEFSVIPEASEPIQLPCPKACSADPTDTSCWPTLTVRSYVISIAAQATNEPSIQRALRSRVRLRNEYVQFNDPAHPGQACPE